MGAKKAGTTWLHHNLKKHPDIGLPNFKELQYFGAREKILNHNLITRVLRHNSFEFFQAKFLREWRNTIFKQQVQNQLFSGNLLGAISCLNDYYNFSNDRLYSSVFSSMSEKITGEITPDYSILNKDSVGYIYQIMPKAKIIFILRNPIDRAWSNTRMNFASLNKDFDSLSNLDFIHRFDSKAIRERSNYLKTLDTWHFYYPEEQFLICFFDELKKQPQDFIRRVCNFLNLDTDVNYLQQISTKPEASYAQDYKDKLSKELRIYLAKTYQPELEKLSARFGGYASQWLDDAHKLLS
ncbi:sulfotransferase [Moorena sp. SIO4A1]|uniref:sulfotransferase family protein n=1 Tax=Moorena sp. SIO4A1 TaxID=2607835 RepID=UPI00344C1639